jgi:hypothetical protein
LSNTIALTKVAVAITCDEDEYFPPPPEFRRALEATLHLVSSTFGVPAPPSPTTAAAARPATVLTSQ